MWEKESIFQAITRLPSSSLEHNLRLWEAETAIASNIPFDENWYTIPQITREQMIAAHLSKGWINTLLEMEAYHKAKHSR
jgi:hypothetical protein